MKYIKHLLALALIAVGLSSANAAILHDSILSGDDSEYISVYDSEYNVIGGYSSSHWEVDVEVYDDQVGFANFTWTTPSGLVTMSYEIGANKSYVTLTSGTDNIDYNAASGVFYWLLYFGF